MSIAPSVNDVLNDNINNSNKYYDNLDNTFDNNTINLSSEEAKTNLFSDGVLEEYIQTPIYPQPYNDPDQINIQSSIIVQKRKPIKLVISTKRKYLGSRPLLTDNDQGSEPNVDLKNPPKLYFNELSIKEKSILEMGFQTKHSIKPHNIKSFQVPKKRCVNSSTMIEENNADLKEIYDKINKKFFAVSNTSSKFNNVDLLKNFIESVRPSMEEALQSNETIDIFQSDFHLDKFASYDKIENNDNKRKQNTEIRIFRDNFVAGQKSKKEKCVNFVKVLFFKKEYLANCYIRNLSFEERIKTMGIPYTGHILFWNYTDVEINSPLFILELPMEATMFEFHPNNSNMLVCALFSGQLMFIEFNSGMFSLENILVNSLDSEYIDKLSKLNKTQIYTYYITMLSDSHSCNITGLKWLPAGYYYSKHMLYNESNNEITILASTGEDGKVLIWNLKALEKQHKNEVNPYFKPCIKIDVYRTESFLKSCIFNFDNRLCSIIPNLPSTNTNYTLKELNCKQNNMFYLGTDEGQIYKIDWTTSNLHTTPDNMHSNIKAIYGNMYYRPVLSLEFSPFYDYIFLTVLDYYFAVWNIDYPYKPIILSPNLKATFYIGGKFSKTRPGVLYLARNTGQIDIWDFVDESHKPSVKETFLKETITFIDLNVYESPKNNEDNITLLANNSTSGLNKSKVINQSINAGKKNKHKDEMQFNISQEYLFIGDQSGQLTVMQASKLFTEKSTDEYNYIKSLFDRELKRQIYMEERFKEIDEEYNKPLNDLELTLLSMGKIDTSNLNSKEKKEEEIKELAELKSMEDNYSEFRKQILEDYEYLYENEDNMEELED